MKRIFLISLFLLGACKEEDAGKPAPIALNDEALGHYCQMYLAEHGGPKAQIHLAGYEYPLWFSQISDAVAYLYDPEQPAEIRAIYVNDMAVAESWMIPGENNWIEAQSAYYVIESDRKGGMETPEAIPFGSEEAAQIFIADHQGQLVRFDAIPKTYVQQKFDFVLKEDNSPTR